MAFLQDPTIKGFPVPKRTGREDNTSTTTKKSSSFPMLPILLIGGIGYLLLKKKK